MNVPRGKMSDYMMHLKIKIGYTSLKTQYLEEQEMEFPKLGGFECVINEMVDENDDDLEETAVLADKCTKYSETIFSLEKQLMDLKNTAEKGEKQLSDNNLLKEQLTHKEAKLKLAENNSRKATRRVEHVMKITEQRMVDCIPDPNFKDDISTHLAAIYATCIEPEDYSFDVEADVITPRNDDSFLKTLKENCHSTKENEEVISIMKNKVLDKVKEGFMMSKSRRDSTASSISSYTSVNSNTSTSKRKKDNKTKPTASKNPKLAEDNKSSLPTKAKK